MLDVELARMQLVAMLLAHSPHDDVERSHVTETLELLRDASNPFVRTCFQGHLTASAVVWRDDTREVLLINHQKLNRWLQPGGHLEPHEDVSIIAGAWRELTEETGLTSVQAELLRETPMDVDVHPIPAFGGEPAHRHHDLRFLFRLTDHDATLTEDGRWAPVPELLSGYGEGLARIGRKLIADFGD